MDFEQSFQKIKTKKLKTFLTIREKSAIKDINNMPFIYKNYFTKY